MSNRHVFKAGEICNTLKISIATYLPVLEARGIIVKENYAALHNWYKRHQNLPAGM